MKHSLRAVLVVVLLSASAPSAVAQAPDTLRTPRGALWRAAVVPGWGQVYNRQYGKLPIVYGGLLGLVFAAVRLDGDYGEYRRAYQYKAWQELVDGGQVETNPNADDKSAYDRIADRLGPVSSSPLRSRRDALRRNRDLMILGTGAAWALSVLDAYVSAHLAGFDVGEDLTLRFHPSTHPAAVTPVAVSLRLTIGGR